MSQPGIVVSGVWKKFRRGERHDSLRDLLPSMARSLARRRDPSALEARDFWALRDVSLSIGPGQALGIIGHNGAGKSTLLKLITRIMRPTLGRCEVRGRVGALIELAAGFHPDLTGRENVYLQGAIMGMPAAVIRQRFDQIVEFAGVTDFIDTPVKRYSSGMNARLGFAIAAHLDPEVLIIDEVLSVGDLAFQERAFGRMEEIVRSGIPVAVVSHQLERVRALCTEAVVLEAGAVATRGDVDSSIAEYVARAAEGLHRGTGHVPGLTVERIAMEREGPHRSGERSELRLIGQVAPPADRAGSKAGFALAFKIRSLQTGQRVYETHLAKHGTTLKGTGPFDLVVSLQLNLPPGPYQLESWIDDAATSLLLGDGPSVQFLVERGAPFQGTVQLSPQISLRIGGVTQ